MDYFNDVLTTFLDLERGSCVAVYAGSEIGMGTETRYLIGLGAKLWKTGVSISSGVNGSAIGTGEIKKTHIHLLLLYIHIILQIISHQSRLLFLYRFILKHLSMMHFCYSQFRSEIALMRRSFIACNMKALFIIEERTKHSNICLRFRPVAAAANCIFFFRFWLLSIIAAFLLPFTHSFLPKTQT